MKAAQAADANRRAKVGRVVHSQRLRVEDDRSAITINTTRFRGEKTDFAIVRAVLQQGIDATPAVQGIKIKCLRQLPGERINIVFASEADATKAKEHSGWLNIATPEAHVKSDAWYPIKCDMISKQAVLDTTVEGRRSLRSDVCAEFAVDNQRDDMDFTATKASWLSKMDPRKRTGSLVIWLKNKVAADYLLKAGQALFGSGAYGAFCSRYEPSTADKMCFNCNAYGHLQGACHRATRCGKCTGPHQTRDCQSTDPPKCAVCAGGHRSSDWAWNDLYGGNRDGKCSTELMIEHLQVLHYNIGRQKHVQWSMLSNEAYSQFAVLAVVEPHLHVDSSTGEVRCGSHQKWRPLTPTVQREHGPGQFAYRAMLWVSAGMSAVQVPVPLHDITAAVITTSEGKVLVVSAYNPNEGDSYVEKRKAINQKLAYVRQAIDEVQARWGRAIEILICSDFNRHHSLWGGQDILVKRRRTEGAPVVHFAQEFGLQSMLPARTITWQHVGKNQHSTVDVILASPGLVDRLLLCRAHKHDHGSDHRAIEIEFITRALQPQSRPSRLMPERADWSQIGPEVARRLQLVLLPAAATEETLDDTAERFMHIVKDVIHQYVPRAKPSPHAKRWWSPDLSLLRETLSASRNYVKTLQRRGEDASEAKQAL
ncbi:hypothetical protein CKM354_000000700 [Cercospora kikuchii]|uniref:Endonuclease/exonuclease/phosphatase domain-containing protein n=1 Tax=Cercospora kikuchii TaxID=84275 RepID=A0A9P3C5G4_9PEZI|nr:uncharacterized protein CKM354_000000700 [Cercospora kikuchii]GIZ36536.1 hypothetical protein CKM354_000000700 [Cercospora kikuchii]